MHTDYVVVVASAAERARQFRDVDDAFRELAEPHEPAPWSAPPTVAEALAPPISLLRDFEPVGPSVEEVFDRFVQRFTQRHALKSQTLAPVQLVLEIAPEQAARGGPLAIGVPVLYPCAACGGTGRDWQYHCTGCGGRGVVAAEEPVDFRVPARLHDGDIVELSLSALGVPDQVLHIGFRVGA